MSAISNCITWEWSIDKVTQVHLTWQRSLLKGQFCFCNVDSEGSVYTWSKTHQHIMNLCATDNPGWSTCWPVQGRHPHPRGINVILIRIAHLMRWTNNKLTDAPLIIVLGKSPFNVVSESLLCIIQILGKVHVGRSCRVGLWILMHSVFPRDVWPGL